MNSLPGGRVALRGRARIGAARLSGCLDLLERQIEQLGLAMSDGERLVTRLELDVESVEDTLSSSVREFNRLGCRLKFGKVGYGCFLLLPRLAVSKLRSSMVLVGLLLLSFASLTDAVSVTHAYEPDLRPTRHAAETTWPPDIDPNAYFPTCPFMGDAMEDIVFDIEPSLLLPNAVVSAVLHSLRSNARDLLP